jgi:hypothetical protein
VLTVRAGSLGIKAPLQKRRRARQPRERTVPLEAPCDRDVERLPLGVVGVLRGLQDREWFTTRKPRSVSWSSKVVSVPPQGRSLPCLWHRGRPLLRRDQVREDGLKMRIGFKADTRCLGQRNFAIAEGCSGGESAKPMAPSGRTLVHAQT